MLTFVRAIVQLAPTLFFFNLGMLGLLGGLDILSTLALAPLVDFFLGHSLTQSSELTQKMIATLSQLPILPSQTEFNFTFFATCFVGLSFLKALAEIGQKYLGMKLKYLYLEHLLTGTLGDLLHGSYRFLSGKKQGELTNLFNHEIQVIGNSLSSLLLVLSNAIRVLFFIGVPLSVSWALSALVFVAFGLVALPSFFLDKLSYRLGKKNLQTANDLQIILQEILGALKIIFGHGKQEAELNRYHQGFHRHQVVTIPFQMIGVISSSLYTPIFLVLLFAVLFFASRELAIKSSEILVILYAFKNMVPLLVSFVTEKNTIAGFLPSLEAINQLRESCSEKKSLGEFKLSKIERITFQSVCFDYQNQANPFFGPINLEILPNRTYAIVGRSGSGKTTLVDLLLGLQTSSQGQILVNDLPFEKINLASYRHRIGLVTQESVLFHLSVKENLLWGLRRPLSNSEDVDHELQRVIRLAYCQEFLSRHEHGLESSVGERGNAFSGGEKQRLSMARALMGQPDLLILDEATSALDSESEKLIQKGLDDLRGKVTMVVIAHRLSTIQHADEIWLMDQGKIILKGTFDQLKEQSQEFNDWLRYQVC